MLLVIDYFCSSIIPRVIIEGDYSAIPAIPTPILEPLSPNAEPFGKSNDTITLRTGFSIKPFPNSSCSNANAALFKSRFNVYRSPMKPYASLIAGQL
ncbi:hypothetical protein JOE25_004252 [Serratia sp. PL17]|uniref:hypothetical protein n=1 Tax=Serratia sp. PL17 TaxID=2806582 RepID=UPI001B499082|nr:hypothetical protein [Serratia sp. PL17]MBP1132646.1 hypothetical protein [Serratia sp. PL17]